MDSDMNLLEWFIDHFEYTNDAKNLEVLDKGKHEYHIVFMDDEELYNYGFSVYLKNENTLRISSVTYKWQDNSFDYEYGSISGVQESFDLEPVEETNYKDFVFDTEKYDWELDENVEYYESIFDEMIDEYV